MTMFYIRLRNFINETKGQDMIEYTLLAALIALVAVVGVRAAGVSITDLFNKVVTELDGATA